MTVPVALQGLVFADAEASSQAKGEKEVGQAERIAAWPNTAGSTSWYLLDRYRNGCDTGVKVKTYSYYGYNAMSMSPEDGSNKGQECAYSGTYWSEEAGLDTSGNWQGGPHLATHDYGHPRKDGDGPMVVMFLKGATSASVQLQGRGYTAVALGVIVNADFGDAPSSYGIAGSVFQPSWKTGAWPSVGSRDVWAAQLADLANDPPTGPGLGGWVDGEYSQPFTDGANGDDEDGDDEDALAAPPEIPVDVLNGDKKTFTIDNVKCAAGEAGKGVVQGWIDWNGNGAFDDDEASDSPQSCWGGSVNLTFTVPRVPVTTDLVNKSRTYLRLRAYNNDENPALTGARGVTTDGEVEDYAIDLPALLKLTKKVENAYGGTAGEKDWKLSAGGGVGLDKVYESGDVKYVEPGTYDLQEEGKTDLAKSDCYTLDSLACERAGGGGGSSEPPRMIRASR